MRRRTYLKIVFLLVFFVFSASNVIAEEVGTATVNNEDRYFDDSAEDVEIIELRKQLKKAKMEKKKLKEKKDLMQEISKINDDIEFLNKTEDIKNKEDDNTYKTNNQVVPLIESELVKDVRNNVRRFYPRFNVSLGASTNGFTGNKVNLALGLGADAVFEKPQALFNPLMGIAMTINGRLTKEEGANAKKYIYAGSLTYVPNEDLLKYYKNYIDFSIRFGNQFNLNKKSNIVTYVYGGITWIDTGCPNDVQTAGYINSSDKKDASTRSFTGWHTGAGVDFVFLKFVMLKLDYKYIGGVNKQFNYDKTANHTFTIGIGFSFGSIFFK